MPFLYFKICWNYFQLTGFSHFHMISHLWQCIYLCVGEWRGAWGNKCWAEKINFLQNLSRAYVSFTAITNHFHVLLCLWLPCVRVGQTKPFVFDSRWFSNPSLLDFIKVIGGKVTGLCQLICFYFVLTTFTTVGYGSVLLTCVYYLVWCSTTDDVQPNTF